MELIKIRRVVGLCGLIFSLTILTWGMQNFGEDVHTIQIQPQPPLSIFPPEILEQGQLVVQWPLKIRLGDTGIVRVRLDMSPEKMITPTASNSGRANTRAAIQIPDLYITHNVFAEARLDISSLEIAPAPEMIESLRPGKSVKFAWSVRPSRTGKSSGIIWFHLHFIPIAGGDESRLPLTAQFVEIETVSILGLGGPEARLWGFIGILAGATFGMNNRFEWICNWIGKRAEK